MALGVSCVLGLGSAPERVQVTLELKARQKAAFVGRLQSATPTRRIRMQKGEGRDRRGPPRRVDHISRASLQPGSYHRGSEGALPKNQLNPT